MRRDQLEHLIRAAGAILDEPEVIVIGSQAILASFDQSRLPAEATRSVEADIVPRSDPDEAKATLIDGTSASCRRSTRRSARTHRASVNARRASRTVGVIVSSHCATTTRLA